MKARRPRRTPAAKPAGLPSAALAATVAYGFRDLDIAATLWFPGRFPHKRGWIEVYQRTPGLDLMAFEEQHGLESERVKYNNQCLERAIGKKEGFLSEYRGYRDAFVPVKVAGDVVAVLVSGPFFTSRQNSIDLLERWRALTSRQGYPSDPEFSHFLHASQSTLVLGGTLSQKFLRLGESVAELFTREPAAEAAFARVEAMFAELSRERAVERMWSGASEMISPRTSRVWASPNRRNRLNDLGLSGVPEQALVGLAASLDEQADPVDELCRRYEFQRAAAELARQSGNVISAPVGDGGIALLMSNRGSPQRTRQALLDLADKLRAAARREFGLSLHLGLGVAKDPLYDQYQAAIGAAEAALSRKQRLVELSAGAPTSDVLSGLRRELARSAADDRDAVAARFERYLQAVAARAGHRLDMARAYLEAGLERVSEQLLGSGALDERSNAQLESTLGRGAVEAASLTQLLALYRRAAAELLEAARHEGSSRRHRSLRHAEAYMREHYSEPLSLSRVAKVAGFAPTYFSELFHEKQRITFERYLTNLRIERARQLLAGSSLSLSRVAELAGFSNRHYFGNVFKRWTGETPLHFRRRTHKQLPE